MRGLLIGFVLLAQVLQNAEETQSLRINGRVYSLLIPHGWKLTERFTGDITLENTNGATFSYRNLGTRDSDLSVVAQQGLDRTMKPLGFAGFSDPLPRKLNGFPAIQYDIYGNRFSEHRKLRYVAFKGDDSFYEIVYESSDSNFELLLPEAERIGSSVELAAVTNERQAITLLRLLNSSEATYHRKNNRYGTLGELISAGALDRQFNSSQFGYRVDIVLAGRGYQIQARPFGDSGRWTFETQQDGQIRYSSQPRFAPRGMAGKVLK